MLERVGVKKGVRETRAKIKGKLRLTRTER